MLTERTPVRLVWINRSSTRIYDTIQLVTSKKTQKTIEFETNEKEEKKDSSLFTSTPFLLNAFCHRFFLKKLVWLALNISTNRETMLFKQRRHLNQVNQLSRCRKSWIVVGTSNPNAEEPTTNSIARNINAMESSNVQKGTTKRIVPI